MSSFEGRILVDGTASGEILLCTTELPGWGSIDYKTGTITEKGHPQFGEVMAGKILCLPAAKGASGWSGQFHITKLNGVNPIAVVTKRLNTKLALGIAVLGVPALIGLPDAAYDEIASGKHATIRGSVITIDD